MSDESQEPEGGIDDSEELPKARNRVFNRTRREVVTGAVATALGGAGVATNASASSSYTEYASEYDSVVNVVEAGADNTGGESITSVLEDERQDQAVFYFPPGRYYMDRQFRFTNFDNFGIVGEDATLIPANYHDYEGPQYRLFRLGTPNRPGGRLRFEGFEVDQTAPETGIRVIDANAAERLEVRDVRIHGQHDSGTWGPGHFNLTDSTGTGIVERFRAPDGGEWTHNTPHDGTARGPIGIEANLNSGTLTFRRCWTGSFPSHGLYACDGSGKIIVLGGWFWNSNGSNLRIGGRESEVRYPTIEVTETREEHQSQRGLRIEKCDSVLVRGPIIRISSPMPTSHAIAVMNSCENARIEGGSIDISGDEVNHGIVVSSNAGEVLIQDTEITHNTAGGYPIWIRESDRTERVHCRNVSVTGASGDEVGFREGIYCGRSNCRFSYCDVDQQSRDGNRRNGLKVTGSDSTVYRSTFRAAHYPYIDGGEGNLLLSSDLESHTSDNEAVRLYAETTNPRLRRSRLVNGIRDGGASGVETFRNTYE